MIFTLFTHEHKFPIKHMCWHSITKIHRNGPRAHFPFSHNDRVKKVHHVISISYSFLFPLSLSYNKDRERGIPRKGILLREGNRPRASLLIRGSKAGPSEGFNSRLRALGLHAHYWSEVRRLAPRKGSTAALGHSGSTPTTDQGFVGWPPKGSTAASDAERGMTLGTFDT